MMDELKNLHMDHKEMAKTGTILVKGILEGVDWNALQDRFFQLYGEIKPDQQLGVEELFCEMRELPTDEEWAEIETDLAKLILNYLEWERWHHPDDETNEEDAE